jgi:hypothetical protein
MAKRQKETKRGRVEDRDRPQPVPVKVTKTPAKPTQPSGADLIRQGIAGRTFV